MLICLLNTELLFLLLLKKFGQVPDEGSGKYSEILVEIINPFLNKEHRGPSVSTDIYIYVCVCVSILSK